VGPAASRWLRQAPPGPIHTGDKKGKGISVSEDFTHEEPVTHDDKSQWWTSRDVLDFFVHTRDCDVKVLVNDIPCPVGRIFYHPLADAYMIELVDGDDYKMALGR
jgi:hypothetical protein